MRWDAVVEAVLDELQQNADVLALTQGTPITRDASEVEYDRDQVRYSVLTNFTGETWETVVLTLVLISDRRNFARLVEAERAIRRLFDADLPVRYGGLWLHSTLLGARDIPGAGDRVAGRSLDIRLEVVRTRYTA